jgi:hypothetical protein
MKNLVGGTFQNVNDFFEGFIWDSIRRSQKDIMLYSNNKNV